VTTIHFASATPHAKCNEHCHVVMLSLSHRSDDRSLLNFLTEKNAERLCECTVCTKECT